jgi:hypothetical protein
MLKNKMMKMPIERIVPMQEEIFSWPLMRKFGGDWKQSNG